MSSVEGRTPPISEFPRNADEAFLQYTVLVLKRPGTSSIRYDHEQPTARALTWRGQNCWYSLSAALQVDKGLKTNVLRMWGTAWKDNMQSLQRRRLAEIEGFIGMPQDDLDFEGLLSHLDQEITRRELLLDNPDVVDRGEVLVTKLTPWEF